MTCKESCNPVKPVLAVNAAEQRLQIVLGNDHTLLYTREHLSRGKLTQILVPALKKCLYILDIKFTDLAGIACVRGPGSFTGLRVGLATLLGVARGASLPLAGIDYLPLLAQAPCSIFSGEVWAMTHARQNLIFIQGFSCPEKEPVMPADCMTLENALDLINSRQKPVLLVGSGLRKNFQFWSTHASRAQFADHTWDSPDPESLLATGLKSKFKQEPIAPVYLRQSDAEENLKQIAQKRGLSLEQAVSVMPK